MKSKITQFPAGFHLQNFVNFAKFVVRHIPYIGQENKWKRKLENFTIGARDERAEVNIEQIIINSKQTKSYHYRQQQSQMLENN